MTEEIGKIKNIDFILDGIKTADIPMLKQSRADNKQRAMVDFRFDLSEYRILRTILSDKIAEVICIAYKYEVFNDRIISAGLNSIEREILLSAIIAADFEDDKRYAKSKLNFDREVAIDGAYNFRMQPLTRKWEQIALYIPQYFAIEELKEFVAYLINEKRGRKIYIEDGRVYDANLRMLNRTRLIPNGGENELIKEVLLSGAGEVIVSGAIDCRSEELLYEFFGNKVSVVNR